MLPNFNERGALPEGIHRASLEEVRNKFARMGRSDKRANLSDKVAVYVQTAKGSGLVERLYLVGSFVTAKEEPNDVDMIVAYKADMDLRNMRPFQYNAIAKTGIRRVLGSDLDAHPVRAGSSREEHFVTFFQTDREGHPVGIVEVIL